MIEFLRKQKTVRIIAALQASLALLVAAGVPLTPELMAGIIGVTSALLALGGDPKPGVDGDPETPA